LFVIFTFIGSTVALPLAWDMGDVSNGLMAAPNLVALIALAGLARKEYREYFERMDREGGPGG
jgi:AGCS family alanine or glycine:cation symporter